MTRTFGSLFAGAGGIDLGLESEGWSCRWQVEINKHAQMVERYHWPDVARYPDVTEINGAEIEPVDVIVGGFPCQDLSSAGQRAGMVEGTRSGLFYEFVRIVKEMRDGTMGASPRWVVWENVQGLLTLGNTLGSCYAAWDEIGAVVQEHRVVDSQFFGVPQRRRRVIGVVGFDPRAESWSEVLSDSEGMRRYHQEIRQTREDTAGGVAGSLGAGRISRSHSDLDGIGTHVVVEPDGTQTPTPLMGKEPLVPDIVGSLTAAYGNQVMGAPEVDANLFLAQALPKVANQLLARDAGGPPTRIDAGEGNLIPTIGDATEVVSLGWQGNQLAGDIHEDTVPPLTTSKTYAVAKVEDLYNIPDLAVRRLTPLECERLMGWPDLHTALGVDEAGDTIEMRDGARYTLCGNGVVAPVAAWVARRIDATDPPDA